MGRINQWVAGLALVTTGAVAPAQAAPHCWAARETVAAQVREMQTMLMVAALRCRAAHIDISADYDGFVIAQRDALSAANLVIKRHFADEGGGQADYDRFATSLANGFGDDATTEASCAEAVALAHEGSAAAPAQLEQVALAKIFPAALPGGSCDAPAVPVTMALAAPVASAAQPAVLPPLLALAPPPAVAAPVMLPADVVAALTVLAHFKAAGEPAVAPTQTALATVAH